MSRILLIVLAGVITVQGVGVVASTDSSHRVISLKGGTAPVAVANEEMRNNLWLFCMIFPQSVKCNSKK